MSAARKIPAPFDMTGRVAVVTGSTKGIGKAIAVQMARHGARVVISSRKADACDAVAAEINAECPDAAIAVPCNITRRDDCRNLIERTVAQWGRIDSLVCNAAVNTYMGPMAEAPDEQIDKTFTANVKSLIWLTGLACPDMARRGDGTVIVISSTGGLRGNRDLGIYGLTKAADIQLVRNLTAEWGPSGIRSNCIAPGLVKTDMAEALWSDPKRHALALRTYPLQRLGEPDDIAGMALMLAADAGRWISGQTLIVDGGAMAAIGRYFD